MSSPSQLRATDLLVAEKPAASGRLDYLLIGSASAAVSIISFLYFLGRDQVLLHGDALAHINIARRIFDSRTPGPLQLGTVWLPLPHILSAPFLISDWAWRTGVGGSIVAMLAYVLGTLGIYRLVRRGLENIGATSALARGCAVFAAFVYAANPNLIYLQATGLTESLSLALFIWAAAYFADLIFALRQGAMCETSRCLVRIGWLSLAATLTRYDGWFATVVVGLVIAIVFGTTHHGREAFPALRISLAKFLVLAALGPALWFGYNAYVFKNPLEFANGPYSAKGIEERTRKPGDPHHPGWHSPYVAAVYFVKATRLILGDWRYDRTWFSVAVVGTALLLLAARGLWPWLLLWLPLPFYAISLAYGGVPIFVPTWWPFSYYNIRYGIQLLPAIAIFFAVALYFALAWVAQRQVRAMCTGAALGLVLASYAFCWVTTPICLREPLVNTRAKNILERAMSYELARLPTSSVLLMYIGDHGGALERAAIPLRRTINEGNWGSWQPALALPEKYADYVVAGAGDPVAEALSQRTEPLEVVRVLRAPEQAPVTIYRVHRIR